MNVSVRANVRTAEASRNRPRARSIDGLSAGAVTGLLVVGLGLLGVAGYYAILTGLWVFCDRPGAKPGGDQCAGCAWFWGLADFDLPRALAAASSPRARMFGGDMVGKVEAGNPRRRSAQSRKPLRTCRDMSATAPAWRLICSRLCGDEVATMVPCFYLLRRRREDRH